MKSDMITKRKLKFVSVMLSLIIVMTQSETVLAMETGIAEDIGEKLVQM